MAQERVTEEKKDKLIKPEKKEQAKSHADGSGVEGRLSKLQNAVGNRAVQRLLVQLKGEGPFEVEDETAQRINRERDGGQSLDEGVADKMGSTLGYDFSDVRVHTTPESADLNTQLSAKAFTTGKDIFFAEGAYEPGSSSGQELLAHELTHVVQQGSGAVGGASRMTVNAPGDAFEQQADAIAQSAIHSQPTATGGVQRQEMPEDEDIQMQADERGIQRVEQEDQEEKLLLKVDEEKKVQRQEPPEEEETAQRQEVPEEEELA
jgi:hypothetical protein